MKNKTGYSKIRLLAALLALIFVITAVASCAESKKDAPETVDDRKLVFTPVTETEETEQESATDETEPEEAPADALPDDTGASEDTDENDTPAYAPQDAPQDGSIAPLALMYHLVLDEPFSNLVDLFVRPSELRGHIEALLEAGYTFIFADEYAYSDRKTVIMSFDDGYLDNYTEMFPIIKEYNVKVTVFMISGYIGCDEYLTSEMMEEMSSSGLVSFQSHTESHPNLASLGEAELRYQFESSNKTIESITGRPVTALCYPTGAYNGLTTAVASDYYKFAYTTVSTVSTAGYPPLELPRMRVNRGWDKAYFATLIQ